MVEIALEWAKTTVTADDGVRLSVRAAGPEDAPVIVCIHGYPDNASLWDGVAALLADRFRVVAYDVRGAGESDRPRALAAYHVDQLAADLATVLDAVSPDAPAHLLAHDWGSVQSWHAVTGDWLRGRVASFTSLSGPDLDHVGHWFRKQFLRPTPRRLRNGLRQLLHSTYLLFFQLPLVPDLAWRSGVFAKAIRRLEPGADPRIADGLHGLKLYRANMFPRLLRPEQRYADVPVQVLAPAHDRYVTPPMHTETGEWVRDLRVRHVPGGHWLPRENPGLVARATAEFVSHVDGGPETRALRKARVGARGRFPARLVVITGGARGIGRATAEAFVADGADVVLADVDEAAVEKTAAELCSAGASVFPYPLDVSDAEGMARFAAAVRDEHGVPDIVVNNAGIGVAGPFADTGVADWERVIEVNLWGVIHGCRAFAPMLTERGEGGHIVNVASAAAVLPLPVLTAYATTKAAVVRLSECLRVELSGQGIGVSAVCPGIVNTGIAERATYVGGDAADQAQRRQQATRGYRRRDFGPERVARDILDAVERDVALKPSAPEARGALVLSRLSPAVLRAGAKKWAT